MITAMTQLLLAIAGYAIFTTVLTIIERIQDGRRPSEDAGRPEDPPGGGPSPDVAPGPGGAEEDEPARAPVHA